MNIGNSIKMCRISLGLSQEALAKKVGVSMSYVSLIEKGKRDPAISTIEHIAAALGVPVSLLTFLAADSNELKGVPEDLRDRLSGVAIRLLHAKRTP